MMTNRVGPGTPANLHATFQQSCDKNSACDMLQRSAGRLLCVEGAVITGTGTVNIPVLKLTGSVEILNQWAEIKTIDTLTNLTNMYADLWDGSTSVVLTKTTGASLSGAPVGTIFSKREPATDAYDVAFADQPRLIEKATKDIINPFIVTANNSAETFIRFNFTTTDAPVLFTADIYFEWRPLDGGHIEVYTP